MAPRVFRASGVFFITYLGLFLVPCATQPLLLKVYFALLDLLYLTKGSFSVVEFLWCKKVVANLASDLYVI